MKDFIVETRQLSKRYGPVVAVDRLSLQIPAGSAFGLLGPNGSGKTTIMSMLLGLIKPTAGSIRLFDNDVPGIHQGDLRRIGAIVDAPSFYDHLSGRANLQFFQGLGRRRNRQEIDYLLDLVGLSDRADSKVRGYSQGMKQRLGIAYALLGDPEMVVLDEPTNGLDPSGISDVRDLVLELRTGGRTVILASHLLHEVEQTCDWVGILARGKLIAQGRVQDLVQERSGIRLKTTNDERARELLASLDWVADISVMEGFLVAQAPPERSGEVTQALAQHDVFVTEMAPWYVSLEELFLKITQGTDTPGPGGEQP